jgi:hypothetical protein
MTEPADRPDIELYEEEPHAAFDPDGGAELFTPSANAVRELRRSDLEWVREIGEQGFAILANATWWAIVNTVDGYQTAGLADESEMPPHLRWAFSGLEKARAMMADYPALRRGACRAGHGVGGECASTCLAAALAWKSPPNYAPTGDQAHS